MNQIQNMEKMTKKFKPIGLIIQKEHIVALL